MLLALLLLTPIIARVALPLARVEPLQEPHHRRPRDEAEADEQHAGGAEPDRVDCGVGAACVGVTRQEAEGR